MCIFSINVEHRWSLRLTIQKKKTIPNATRSNKFKHRAEHMGEALIPFYAMLDTRNAIWCPRSVWRRRNSMSEDGRMMLERVHACDETCYFIHKLGWDEEVCTGCLKSRFRKSFRHLYDFSFFNTLYILPRRNWRRERARRWGGNDFDDFNTRLEHVGKTWIGRRNERNKFRDVSSWKVNVFERRYNWRNQRVSIKGFVYNWMRKVKKYISV